MAQIYLQSLKKSSDELIEGVVCRMGSGFVTLDNDAETVVRLNHCDEFTGYISKCGEKVYKGDVGFATVYGDHHKNRCGVITLSHGIWGAEFIEDHSFTPLSNIFDFEKIGNIRQKKYLKYNVTRT